MARVFTANVVARHPETGEVVVFKIGDDVPENLFVGDHAAASEGVTGEVQTSKAAPAGDDTTVINPDAAGAAEDDDENELPPYSEWSKTDLRAEVDGRQLEVAKKATVDELVAALEADDLANPVEETE
jgi:hypothetical protein